MTNETNNKHRSHERQHNRRSQKKLSRRSPIIAANKDAKGAQLIWRNGIPVQCVVRNLSEAGAKIVVHSPVPGTFDLVFDCDQSRRSCRVVWRKEIQMGVQFI